MSDWGEAARLARPGMAESAFVWFQRLVALYCLVFGVLYWARLVGVYEGTAWRFDLMPAHWQVAAVSLSVFYPFAAIGLWMLASWGPVIWLICAAGEITMHFAFPDLFGESWPVIMIHVAAILLYAGFRFVLYRQRRSIEVSAH
jgi:hypothetical protein